MKFEEALQIDVFDAFVNAAPFSHYMHTSTYAKFKQLEDKCTVYYTGLYENNEVVATAIVLEYKEPLVGSYMYVPCGMCMDYSKLDLVDAFTNELVAFAKKHDAVLLKIDPNVLRVERTLIGDIVEGGINNEHITEHLKQLGFTHRGYNYAYDGSMRNRYTLIVDTDKPFEDVLKNMPKSKQNYFKRQSKMAITVTEGGKELAKELAIYAKELADIQHFTPHTQAYFEMLINAYQDMGHTYVCTIDFGKQIALYEAELQSGKYKKDLEARAHCEKDLEKTKEYQKQFGNIAVLGVAFYVAFADKSYNLFNYINKELTMFRGTDAIHYNVIQDMMKRGVKHYDLVGFSGLIDKNDLYYGLYDYKKTLGPAYIEHIGEFDYILKPTSNSINKGYLSFRKTLSRIKRKLQKS
ncbi:MAG: peptidoglycan bridge formation glycyltransferase FemA/FemB family protein [Erysipelotrichales bacterium]|nr:peptidoglycan bridge formation glycyltransferase FemA/FemB family protein [Erysipelotrichales bacterium]